MFPVPAGGGVGGYRAEGGDRPGGRGLGGVLAQAPGAVVHHGGDLGQVGMAVGIGQPGTRPVQGPCGWGSSGWTRGRIRASRTAAMSRDPARSRDGDGGADDLGGVQAGQFGGVQGAVQPAGLVRERLAVAGRERGHDQVAVTVVAGGGGFGGPDGVQDGEVVGVGQVPLPDRGGGHLGAVAAKDVGEHGDRLALGLPGWLVAGRRRVPGIRRVRVGCGRTGRVQEPPGCQAAGRRAGPGW